MDNNNKYVTKYSISMAKGDKQIGTVYLYGITERLFAELYTRRRAQVFVVVCGIATLLLTVAVLLFGNHMGISAKDRVDLIWGANFLASSVFFFTETMLDLQSAIDDHEVTARSFWVTVFCWAAFFLMTKLTGENWGTLILGLVSLGMQIYYSVTNAYLTTNYLDNIEQNLLSSIAKEGKDNTDDTNR